MMPRFPFFILIFVSIAFAKTLIECRVSTKGVKTCDPYSKQSLPILSHNSASINGILQEKGKVDFLDALEKKASQGQNQSEPEPKEALEKHAQELEKQVTDDNLSIKSTLKPKEQQGLEEKYPFGIYTVEQGDVLGYIAEGFGMKIAELRALNRLKKSSVLHIGQKLKVTSPQEIVDAISSGKYRVKPNDTLSAIAKKFKLSIKSLAKVNKLKSIEKLAAGKVLKLPLPYKIGKGRYYTYGTKSLRVTATAYTSHPKQTDNTPFLAAWNNRLFPGMKIIAVSRDLLSVYGIRNGTRVRISGLNGIYLVKDKMNKRYKRRIDIYMGVDKRKALRWGKKIVNIHWD